jgi:hypothetical protein
MRLVEVVAQQLRKRGIPGRHVREFATPTDRWRPQKLQDFFGEQWGQMGPGGGSGVLDIAHRQLLSVLPSSFLAMPDFRSFAAELRGVNEIVRWPLYHYKAYATTGHAQLQFFDQTEGSATLGRADTNMKSIGQLPGNEMQVAVSLRVVPIPAPADVAVTNTTPAVAFADWYKVLTQTCWAEVIISDKEYVVAAPLTVLPAGFGPGTVHTASAVAASTQNVSHLNNGTPDNSSIFKLDPPIGILPTRPFKVLLNWRTLQTITTAGRIGVILDGWKLRAVL